LVLDKHNAARKVAKLDKHYGIEGVNKRNVKNLEIRKHILETKKKAKNLGQK
jgi:hypothetical protein